MIKRPGPATKMDLLQTRQVNNPEGEGGGGRQHGRSEKSNGVRNTKMYRVYIKIGPNPIVMGK